MAKSGYDLYLDIDRLRRVGLVDLPNMANDYSELNHRTAATSDVDEAAFSYDEWGMDCVYDAWSELRNKLQNIFGHCQNRYDAAGEALVHIADVYQSTDAEAARLMRNKWGANGNDVPHGYWNKGDIPVGTKVPPPVFAKKEDD